MQIIPYSWDDILIECQRITKKFQDKKIDYIFGVSTGGIIPGFVVASLLKKDYLYANLRPNKEKIDTRGKSNILIIDDILDTGKTKEVVIEMFSKDCKIYFETLFKAKKNTWLVFPYESPQDKPNSRQTKN